LRFIIKLGKGQVSIEVVVILGIVVIGAILIGSFYISSIMKKTQGATDISGVTDDYDRWFNEPANNQGNNPTPPPATTSVCGNGIIESGEQCDVGDLNSQTCISQLYAGGNLGCYSSTTCQFDYSSCTGPPATLNLVITPTADAAQANTMFTVDLNSMLSDVNYNLDINIFDVGVYPAVLTTNCSYNNESYANQFNLGNNLSPGIYHYNFSCNTDGQYRIWFNAISSIDNTMTDQKYSDWGIYTLPLPAFCSTTTNSFGTFTACASPNNGYGKSEHLEIFVNQQEVNYSCDNNGTNVLCITVG